MNCSCNEWSEGMPQIAAAQVFCSIQSAGPEYTGATFKFCPWCGKPVGDNKEIDEALDLQTDGLLLQWAKESADEFITLEELCQSHRELACTFNCFSDILRLECDEDGTYIVGDYTTVAYGDGETPLEALRDYIVSLIEYSELLLKSEPVGQKLVVKAFVDRVCKRAEENMERTGKLEGSHYNAMLTELEKIETGTFEL